MKKIIYLIAIFTGIIAFGQQEHSGGISIATGFKLEDPQPIDDKYVVADSASLNSLPNVYEGLWSYSKADSAIFVYDGVKWGRIGGANGFIELSKSQLDAAIGGGNLVAGALYKITGVNPELYGGTDIYLTAISSTELNPNGVGKFYNPKYDKDVAGFGIVKDYVWWADLVDQKESGVYDVDDVVIWGGKHWVCVQETSVSTKYIVDDFELDTDYFEAINYNETDYNIAFDAIKYDYENDWIIERNEKGSNIVSFSYDWLVYFSNEYWGGSVDYNHPIRGFMWGNIYDDYKGVGFQTITNSLNRNINFSGSYQSNLTFNNNSYQDYLTFDNNSYQDYLTFDNSGQYNLTFDNNSYQFYLTFNNSSYQSNLAFNNSSYQNNLTFDNYSRQDYLTFDNSGQSNLTFDNVSGQYNLTFDNSSYQSYLTFDNNSYQDYLTFDNSSYQYFLTFDNRSYQDYLTFDNSGHQDYLTFDNYSRQTDLTSSGSNRKQEFLTFNSYQSDRTGQPLDSDENNLTFNNTSQGLKLKGTEVFSITDDKDYIQKKYVDDNYISTSQKGANNGVATLDGGGKIPATQLPNSVMTLEGEWNASTNTPTLADGVGNAGQIYEVTTAGTIDLGSGDITFAVGDYVVYGSSGVWYKSANSNEVTSVNGQTGVVNLGINSLSDTPANFTGAGGKFLSVNSGATGVEYRGILPSDFGSTANSRVFYSTGSGTGWDSFLATSGTNGLSLVVRTATGQGAFADPTTSNHAVTLGYANANYQPLDGDLTSIAGLSGTSGLLRKTAADTWSLDTNTYATTGDLGDYVPLSGTEVENPITGEIVFDIEVPEIPAPYEKTNALIIGNDGDDMVVSGIKSGVEDDSSLNGFSHWTSPTTGFNSYIDVGVIYTGLADAPTIGSDFTPDTYLGNEEQTIITRNGFYNYNVGGVPKRGIYINSNEIVWTIGDGGEGSIGYTYQYPGESGTLALIEQSGTRIIIPITDDFTLPAMSSPPNQNSFAPITILEDTELPDDHIDWEITWKDSGYTYKLSSLGDFNTQIRESGGDIQIGGQTRSASDIVIDADTMEPVLILKF